MSQLEAQKAVGKRPGHPLILLLPGSRQGELRGVLPVMLEALPLIKKDQPDADFILQKAPNVDRRELEAALDTSKIPVRIVEGHPYDTMGACDAALATSGTVVLEAALMDLPSVICYKASPISMAIAKALVKVKYAGLPNLLAGREILPELIQEKMTPENMARHVLRFWILPKGPRSIRIFGRPFISSELRAPSSGRLPLYLKLPRRRNEPIS